MPQESYEAAVERAGVIELPADDAPSPLLHPPDLPTGRSEDDNTPGASR